MLPALVIPLGWLPLLAPADPPATVTAVPITVRETAGLRRFGFPVTAAVPFRRGALKEVDHARLVDATGREVAAQITPVAFWPEDRSIQWVEVDFNASPAPNAVETYTLECGPSVQRSRPSRGVVLTETEDAYQAGAFRVPKQGRPLLTSVRYGEIEYLRPEGAELTVVDRSGAARGVNEGSVRTRVVKTEPILVMLEQRGEYGGAGRPLPFRTTMEFPSTKSWVRLVHEIADAGGEVREIVLRLPFALETEPRLFDFGVGSWLYGALRTGQAATLTQRVAASPSGTTAWDVILGGADAAPYAASAPPAGPARAEGWGHVMDSRKTIAFGIAGFAAAPGEYSMRLEHDGDCLLRWRPDRAVAAARGLRVESYFHFIPFPPQLTAATSPPSMLAPLVARCSPETYQAAGVPAPR